MGLFVNTAFIGDVVYHIDLVDWFSYIHPIFYVGLLSRFIAVSDGVEPPQPIKVDSAQEYVVVHLL